MIRVIIERVIAETLEANYEDTAMEILQRSVRAPGFISGESMRDLNNPRHRFVLCKWRSAADWNLWYDSPERRELMDRLNLMLAQEEKITLLGTN
jgi:heme-degrading monooxygenase HmoA